MVLQKHAARILDVLLDLDKELHGFAAIKQAMIICQRKIHHWSDLNFAVDHNWAFLYCVQAQNSCLREVDDRSSHERAENPAVADCKGSARHVLDC